MDQAGNTMHAFILTVHMVINMTNQYTWPALWEFWFINIQEDTMDCQKDRYQNVNMVEAI